MCSGLPQYPPYPPYTVFCHTRQEFCSFCLKKKTTIYEGNVLFDNSVFRYTYTHAYICTHVHSSIRTRTSSYAAINHIFIDSVQKVFILVNGIDLSLAVKLMRYNILNASTFL